MNGQKFPNDFGKSLHNHIHDNPANATDDSSLRAVIEKDALTRQDHTTDRAHFQGRFRATTYGDFKNMPGRAPEMAEALVENRDRNERAKELLDAATEAGVVIEDTDLHRLADDGGPVHG
jgi:ADP-ribosylglycohydrolase